MQSTSGCAFIYDSPGIEHADFFDAHITHIACDSFGEAAPD
ncbi:MAG: hypothetical protein Q8L40_09735 [Burkholderiales bacterium]|nr:hypothetical protein [Burkholderiales bacterium]